MRAVEDADVATFRQGISNPPQVVVLALLLGWLAETGVGDAHRTAGAHHMFDDPALAGGVHALQYQ